MIVMMLPCCEIFFGQVSKGEMIILSTFVYVVKKPGKIIKKKKRHIIMLCIQIPASSDLQKSSAQKKICYIHIWNSVNHSSYMSPFFSMKCMKLFSFYGTQQLLNVEGYKNHQCLDLYSDTTNISEKWSPFCRLRFVGILELLVHLQCLWAVVMDMWTKNKRD